MKYTLYFYLIYLGQIWVSVHQQPFFFIFYIYIVFHFMDIHNLIIQFSIDGHFDYLQHFVITNITAMGNLIQTSFCVCASSICKINSLELDCWAQRQIFNFGKHWKFPFCRHCVYMHLHQQYVKGPVSTCLPTHCHQVFECFSIWWKLSGFVVVLFCFNNSSVGI